MMSPSSSRSRSSISPIAAPLLLLLIIFILLLATIFESSHAAPWGDSPKTAAGKSKSSSLFSLFNLKSKSKFWTENLIRGGDFDDLETSLSVDSFKKEMDNYTSSGNIANFLKITEVDSIYLPIPLNFIFIGFDGKGNHGFKLTPEEMERWFTKIDHIFEHTRIPPVGEVHSPFYKISIDKVQRHHLPLISHVNYNFSVHAIHMGEKVTAVFEQAIHTLSRKEYVADSSFSVHARHMGEKVTAVFKQAIHALSHKEYVADSRHMGEKVTAVFKKANRALSHKEYVADSSFSVHARHMGEKVTAVFKQAIRALSHKEYVADSREDENILWQVDIDRMEYLFSTLVDYLQIEDAYNIFILNPKRNVKRAQYGYRRGLSESEISFLKKNRTFQTSVLEAKSVTGNPLDIDKGNNMKPLFVNRPTTNFAWTTTEEIDTIEWSKKCLDALSSVEKNNEGKDSTELMYNKVVEMLHDKKDDLRLLLEKELKSGELAGLQPECLTDTWIGSDRWAFIDLTAGPFSWGPAVGGEGVRTELSLPNVGKTSGSVAEITEDEAEDKLQEAIRERFSAFDDDHQAIDILMAEIDIYELFAFKHCQGRRVKLPLCEELDERMHDLKSELEDFNNEESDESHRRKAIDALKRMEKWNLFSDTPEEYQSYTVARDSFLAHLGATLWGSMRHIIAPSVADGAYHHYEKISYQIYFITQEKVRNINWLPVNLKTLKDGLHSLLVPSQKVMFSEHLVALSEDPALTMAFSVARRAATVPLLLVNATYRITVRTYLDSSILQHQLQKLNGQGSLKGAHASARSTLEVPIFWFVNNEPLLVDKHYQAKALSDMIIVIQSETSNWETHLQCNGNSLLLDLRRPIKAAVAATAEHLAGLLPLHLVYSRAHENAIEDWTWSVGCNPLSITSQGWQLSRFQSDVIARNYIITALEESILDVNAAIHLLTMERTTARGFKLFKTREREMVEKYNAIISLWRRISNISRGLRYGDAIKLISVLEDASQGFTDHVNSTISSLHPIHCTRERKVKVEFDPTTIPAFLVVFAVLWFVLRPRRSKPKIN